MAKPLYPVGRVFGCMEFFPLHKAPDRKIENVPEKSKIF